MAAASVGRRLSARSQQLQHAGDVRHVAFFSAKQYDQDFFKKAQESMDVDVHFHFHEVRLCIDNVALAEGCGCVCLFVNDFCDAEVVSELKAMGVKLIAMRCAGFDAVDTAKAAELGIIFTRVPAYSPDAVAEHAVSLATAVNRKIPSASTKTKLGNFSLIGQLGFDMKGKRVGIIGTGLIGSVVARIFKRGFECDVVAHDAMENPKISDPAPKGLGIPYVELDELFKTADMISLHAPLLPTTKHMINDEAIAKMKDGVLIINVSRGMLIDTEALIRGLRSRKVGGAGLDVYEHEDSYFFEDLQNDIIEDDVLNSLLSFNNVTVTSHQAFFTQEALTEISEITVRNIGIVAKTGAPPRSRASTAQSRPSTKDTE